MLKGICVVTGRMVTPTLSVTAPLMSLGLCMSAAG